MSLLTICIASLAVLMGHDALAEQPRGYSIPMVDLAWDWERQTTVDQEPGQYLGHPTTVLLEDGTTILCVYPKGHGRGAVVYKRSTDGGLTWSDRLPTPENWSTSKETPTIHRVIDPKDGTRRLIMFSGLYPIRMAVSEDDGASWSALEPIGDWGGIVAMGDVVRLKDGRYAAYFHDDGRFFRNGGRATGTMTLYQTISNDGGLTWGEPEIIYASSDVHLCEPGLVRSPDGARLAMLLRENRRVRNAHVMFSDDESATWSEPAELPGALTGDRHTARYLPDGRLFISFRDTTHESKTQGDWVGWLGTWEDIAEGREGQCRVRLMDNHHRWDCAYPGVEVLPDGTIVTTTYGHWTPGESPYIVSVRLHADELDAWMDRRTVTLRGKPMHLEGQPVRLGEIAPDFVVVDTSMQERRLTDYRGKTIVISVAPSLDTGVCAAQTRAFNERATALGDDVVILTVTLDLPMAQARWCGANGVDRVETLSDYRYWSFAEAFGLRMRENGLLARAVYVLDSWGVVRYEQIVEELTTEPDYDAAFKAVSALVD